MAFSVEIFHDQASGRLPTEAVHEGLAKVGEHAGELVVKGETRQLKIGDPAIEAIDVDKIRWPRFSAHFSVLLTERLIMDSHEPAAEAQSLATKSLAGTALFRTGIAIIKYSPTNQASRPSTVAHELGHLFTVTPFPSDETGHCSLASCLMTSTVKNVVRITPDRSAPAKRFKYLMGKAEMQSEFAMTATEFCESCADDLTRKSPKIAEFVVLRAKGYFDKL